MDHAYVIDYAVQIPFWVVVPLLLILGWVAWKLVMWAAASFR